MGSSRADAGAPAIALAGVDKAFGAGAAAVAGLTLDVHANQFVTLVGPSGCGKSTTLRMVAGLVAPTAGRVAVRGRPVTGPLRDVGMVFQSPVLLPWRTALANVLFTAEMSGAGAAGYRSKARELLRLAGLAGFEHRYPHELSGGMQQRVAICRALLLDPSLLLMDEPFGALDVMTREKLAFELQRMWAATRTTVLFVTHSITEAVLLSDVIVVMTARPGTVRAVIAVDLPRPRDAKTLSDPRFVELAAAVRDNIESQWLD
ncbi:MAG TPA: ABC transporter ATP-binding protein [Methylomirabilota bacterium]|nr:ABC transporter ATP-binding protein [Methylomirabilota bacterium]